MRVLYDKKFAVYARKLCEQFGATNLDLAKYFGVTDRTIYNWQNRYEDFAEALKCGKTLADDRVVRALYERATGYSHPEDKILANPNNPSDPIVVETMKHYPPDVGACVVWLANRRPEDWKKDPTRNNSGENGPINEPTKITRELVKPKKVDW